MPYDKTLDEVKFTEEVVTEKGKLIVSVYAYNNGESKLQISRQVKNNDEYKFAKLGRLAKAEVEAITPLITKAVANM